MLKEINRRIQHIERIITRKPYTPMEIAQGVLDGLNPAGKQAKYKLETIQVSKGDISML